MADIACKEIGPGCPADGSPLGYAPNMAASVAFMGIFSLSLFGHTFLGCKYRTWSFMTAMLLGSSSEVVGYLGRILMHNNPYRLSTFVPLKKFVAKTTLTFGKLSCSNCLSHHCPRFLLGRNLPLSRENVRPLTRMSTILSNNHIQTCGGTIANWI